MWLCKTAIPTLERWREEDQKYKVFLSSLGYLRLSQNKKEMKKKKKKKSKGKPEVPSSGVYWTANRFPGLLGAER